MKAQDIIILAGVGLGAYVLLARRAVAVQRPAAAGMAGGNMAAITNGLGALGRLFGGSSGSVPLLGTWDGRSQTPWDVTPDGNSGQRANNPSAYIAPGSSFFNDGVAINPVVGAPWDWASMYGNA